MKIALHGKACSGKSFVAQILHEEHGYQVVSFAEPIRDAVVLSKRYLAHAVPTTEMADFLLGLTDEETALRMYREWYGMVLRHTEELLTDQKARGFMQEWGTVFKLLDSGVFIRAALEGAEDDSVIDDLRLSDEGWALADQGWMLVKVEVPEVIRKQRAWRMYPTSCHLLWHHTETDLDDWEGWHGVVSTDCPKNELPARVQKLLDDLDGTR